MIYFQLIFQLITIGLLAIVFFSFRSKSSQLQNELAISHWFSSMDIVVNGQRWRGERSQMIESIEMEKRFAGIKARLLCATRSGRWFILCAETRFSLIISWNIEPITEDKASEFFGIKKEEFLLMAKKNIVWKNEYTEANQNSNQKVISKRTSDQV